MEKRYTIGQAADYLNKSVNTLQRLDREQKLIAKRTDTNRRFYTKDQLDRYLETEIIAKKGKNNYYFKHYTRKYYKSGQKIVGLEHLAKTAITCFNCDQLSDLVILGKSGVGKSTLVQYLSETDKDRVYYKLDLPCLISDNSDDISKINIYFNEIIREAEKMSKKNKRKVMLVVDEAHQLILMPYISLSNLLTALKSNNVGIILLTTYTEYQRYIVPNHPLWNKIQTIRLREPDEAAVISILHNKAQYYGVLRDIKDKNKLFKQIYGYTKRLMPEKTQPRVSIDIFNQMVGWHRMKNEPFDRHLLYKVLDINFK